MAKLAIKSDNITPFGGLYSIFNRFSASGLRETIDSHLGRRSSDPKAFTYGDVFGSLFGSYLCGGDCIEDVMDIKPFWDGHESIRIASSDTIERTLRSLAEDNISYESGNFRLVVQRTLVSDEDPEQESEGIFGTEYVYRCIITNDWSNSERDIILYYNKRGGIGN